MTYYTGFSESASATPLESDADWTLQSGAANGARTLSGTLRNNGGSSYTCPNQGSADHYAEATLVAPNSNLQYAAVCARLVDTSNYVGWRCLGTGSTDLQLVKRVAGTNTPLVSTVGASGVLYRVEAQGSTVRLYADGVQVGSDASYTENTTATGTGVRSGGSFGTTAWLDDFGAGALSAGAVTHAASGALAGGGASVSGTAQRTRDHAASGVLLGQGAALSGSAARSAGAVAHDASGTLVASGALSSGSAQRTRVHASDAVLSGGMASLSGSASRATGAANHDASGSLSAAGAQASGTAQRFRLHAASGGLSGAGAIVVGESARFTGAVVHDAAGALSAAGAQSSGAVERTRHHAASGGASGAGAALSGLSKRNTTHTAAGALSGQGGRVSGAASRPVSLSVDSYSRFVRAFAA